MTLLYLIRHGENEFVSKGKLAGWLPGIHLNDKGIAQAEMLVDYFSKRKIDAIYSSPLERTYETAKPISESKGLKVIKTKRLGEIGYGRWEGQSLKVLRRRKLWPIVQTTPSLAIKLVLAHYIGLPIDLFQRLVVFPASISTLHFDPGIRLISLNESAPAKGPHQE
jgi:probable phosphoglycerate mutase